MRYTVEECGGACPTQAWGRTADDRPFYFRARHGEWTVETGPVGAPTDYGEWWDCAVEIAAGNDPTCGWMTRGEVESVLDAALGETVAPPHL